MIWKVLKVLLDFNKLKIYVQCSKETIKNNNKRIYKQQDNRGKKWNNKNICLI